MNSRIEDVPKLHTESTIIEAHCYNQIRLGLLRLEQPLRVSLPGLRGMDMILEDNAWICVDRTLYDLPVLAWTDFGHTGRGLHEPVHCMLHYYHHHADMITETVLETLNKVITERLGQLPDRTSLGVRDFPDDH